MERLKRTYGWAGLLCFLICGAAYVQAGYELSAQWGSQGRSPGSFSKPADVAVCGSGFVYVAEVGNNRIQKFTLDGEFVASWGKIGAREGEFSLPRGIAVDGEGNVYVSDWGNSRVQKFSSQGDFIEIFCGRGTATSDYVNFPLGIAVDGMGNVYVASSDNRRVRKFDKRGNHILDIPVSSPWVVTASPDNDIYINDRDRILQFSQEGERIRAWGIQGVSGGRLNAPRGLTVNEKGEVYVSSAKNFRVQKFSPAGVFIEEIGDEGCFTFPYGIDMDRKGNLYIVDYYGHRVRKFSPAEE